LRTLVARKTKRTAQFRYEKKRKDQKTSKLVRFRTQLRLLDSGRTTLKLSSQERVRPRCVVNFQRDKLIFVMAR